jgi:major cell surface glycoprotein (TIGR04216 family)
MNGTNDKLRASVLAALMVTSVFAGTITFAGTATAENDFAGNTAPVTVYLGDEEVNLSQVPGLTTSLIGVAGEADGGIAGVSSLNSADITTTNGFEQGGYSNQSDGDLLVSVQEPQISDVTLEIPNGADVTNSTVTNDQDTLNVAAEWNFARYENVTITVEDEAGLEVQDRLGSNLELESSDDVVTLTGLTDLDAGQYTLTVEGEDDLDGTSRSVTFSISDQENALVAEQATATQGDSVVITATGNPGETVHVRVERSELLDSYNDPNDVFPQTGDIEDPPGVINATDEEGTEWVAAALALGDDGEASTRIQTTHLDTDTIDIELAQGTDINNSAEDSTELTVEQQSINLTATPNVVRIGEDFTVEGRAVESDEVAAYVRIDDDWERVEGDENPVDTNVNGSFTLELTALNPLHIPDSYRLAVVNQEAFNDNDQFPATLSDDEFGDLETEAAFDVRTVEGDLTAQLSSQQIAASVGDGVTVSGTALGQGNNVRIYKVGPRGGVQFVSADVDDEEFSEEFDSIDDRGAHTFIVVGEGRDGTYAAENADSADVGGEITGDEVPQQAVAIIKDAYTGAGVDDQVIELTLQAENPQLSLDDFTTDGQVAQGELTVSGTSNREDETVVFIEVLNQNDNVVASTDTEVNGTTNEWSATLDLTDVETGTYTLRATDDETSASVEFELVNVLNTPSETPVTETPTATPELNTPTETPEPNTPTETPETTTPTQTTSTQTPGFGGVIALMALFGAALLAYRRS